MAETCKSWKRPRLSKKVTFGAFFLYNTGKKFYIEITNEQIYHISKGLLEQTQIWNIEDVWSS